MLKLSQLMPVGNLNVICWGVWFYKKITWIIADFAFFYALTFFFSYSEINDNLVCWTYLRKTWRWLILVLTWKAGKGTGNSQRMCGNPPFYSLVSSLIHQPSSNPWWQIETKLWGKGTFFCVQGSSGYKRIGWTLLPFLLCISLLLHSRHY